MAAYGTDPAKYLPPHTSQLATKLSAEGVDDCLVLRTLRGFTGILCPDSPNRPRQRRTLRARPSLAHFGRIDAETRSPDG